MILLQKSVIIILFLHRGLQKLPLTEPRLYCANFRPCQKCKHNKQFVDVPAFYNETVM